MTSRKKYSTVRIVLATVALSGVALLSWSAAWAGDRQELDEAATSFERATQELTGDFVTDLYACLVDQGVDIELLPGRGIAHDPQEGAAVDRALQGACAPIGEKAAYDSLFRPTDEEVRLRFHQAVLTLECLDDRQVDHSTVLPTLEEFAESGMGWPGIEGDEVDILIDCAPR